MDLVRGAAGGTRTTSRWSGASGRSGTATSTPRSTVGSPRCGSQGVAAGDALLLLVGNDVTSVVAIHAGLRAGALVMVAPTTAGARRSATSCP